ncbi:hypothetical protein DGo_PB0291 (plasmid) [Deinococcus gobiensis I-0]|uniref:Uncharacterized protein n=1 Tax=Deinococcus gobiensis (strain DSM 21396 / JCM 16679 / CGMCC 1.7299 / I-0) TaxID=745776 RepID=H8H213_DEIGI|nr:hypothetical protein DGo_PB0291 [Deinococcus gobiensis I-0]
MISKLFKIWVVFDQYLYSMVGIKHIPIIEDNLDIISSTNSSEKFAPRKI